MIRKCPVCNKALDDWADLCPQCGQPQTEDDTQPTVQLPRMADDESWARPRAS